MILGPVQNFRRRPPSRSLRAVATKPSIMPSAADLPLLAAASPIAAAVALVAWSLAIVGVAAWVLRAERRRRLVALARWWRTQPRAAGNRRRPPSSKRRRGGVWDEPVVSVVQARPDRPSHRGRRRVG